MLAHPYWNVRDQVHEAEGLMFLGEKLIVPAGLRKEMLNLVHESHQGIENSLARGREVLYWPGMARDIEDTFTCCTHGVLSGVETIRSPFTLAKFSLDRGQNWKQICLNLRGKIISILSITSN